MAGQADNHVFLGLAGAVEARGCVVAPEHRCAGIFSRAERKVNTNGQRRHSLVWIGIYKPVRTFAYRAFGQRFKFAVLRLEIARGQQILADAGRNVALEHRTGLAQGPRAIKQFKCAIEIAREAAQAPKYRQRVGQRRRSGKRLLRDFQRKHLVSRAHKTENMRRGQRILRVVQQVWKNLEDEALHMSLIAFAGILVG